MNAELKTKIDSLWQFLWDKGMANPQTNLRQITYLLFIKLLDDKQIQDEEKLSVLRQLDPDMSLPDAVFGEGNYVDEEEGINVPYANLRWSKFKEFGSPERIYDNMRRNVFPFIKKLKTGPSVPFGQFMQKANFEVNSPAILDGMIQRLSDPVFNLMDSDVMGDCYEILLARMSTSGELGQFRSPRHIIDMMVAMAAPKPSDKIIDPSMGTAGFLIQSAKYVQEHYHNELMQEDIRRHFDNEMFTGFDIDSDMVAFGCMNTTLHGIENPNIRLQNSLGNDFTESNKYTLILANPPFKGSLDAAETHPSLTRISGGTKKTELLFIALFLRMLQAGGRCFSIVPDGVLFGSNKAYVNTRKEIVENHKLEAVISMPSGVFKPYAGVSTAVLVFTKTGNGGTDHVWFYDMKADGMSLDDKRLPVSENDIPDIIERFHHRDAEMNRSRTEQSFMVPKQEIADNSYDLSINKYKKTEYVAVEYPSTLEIMTRLDDNMMKLGDVLEELRGML